MNESDWNDHHECPKLGVAADGSFEIAWGAGFSWTSYSVKARRFNANGSPAQRSSVLVTAADPWDSEFAYELLAVSPVSTGFRVLMAEEDGSPKVRFLRRRIAPDGVPAPGDPRPVGSAGTQWVLPGPGDVVFAGRYDARQRLLSLQKVDSLGTPAGKVYGLNSRPLVLKYAPVLAPLSDGGWVVAYAGISVAGPGSPARQVIRARRFNAAGDPVGPDFDVNTIPGGPPKKAPYLGDLGLLIAGGPSGQFAVAWDVAGSTTTVRARFFNAANVPIAAETIVASGREIYGPDSMAFDGSGRLLVVWLAGSNAQPGFPSFDLRTQLLGPDGSPLGSAFSPRSRASEEYPSLLCSSVGWSGDSWLIAWKGFYREDESNAIFLRRFR
ncbi:MAG: hypothetical protein ACJ75H_08705 [Thermoanaerobaculia bacterium]